MQLLKKKWISQELQKIPNPRVMYFFFHAVVATLIAHINTPKSI